MNLFGELSRLWTIVLFILTLSDIIQSERPERKFDPQLSAGHLTDPGAANNPGMKIKLTDSGIRYFKYLAVRTLQAFMNQVELPQKIERPLGPKGYFKLDKAKIVEFRAPRYFDMAFTQDNQLRWFMRQIQVRFNGQFDAARAYIPSLPGVRFIGEFEALIHDMSFDLLARIFTAPQGQPLVSVDFCHSVVHSMDLYVKNSSLAFKVMKPEVVTRLKSTMGEELCKMTTQMINRQLNIIFLTMPTQQPIGGDLFSLFSPNQSSPLYRDVANPEDAKKKEEEDSKLMIDYRLIDRPQVGLYSVETWHKGEISSFGQGNTPFYPEPMNDTILTKFGPNRNKMLWIYASDYVTNSLLYHAHHQKMLKFRLNSIAYPKFAPFFRTSCASEYEGEEDYTDENDYSDSDFDSGSSSESDDNGIFGLFLPFNRRQSNRNKRNIGFSFGGINIQPDFEAVSAFCLGDIMENLAQRYPNNEVELRFQTKRPPTLFFTSKNGGVIDAHGSLFISLFPKPKFLLHAFMHLQAILDLQIRDDVTIGGSLKIANLTMRLTRSRLTGISQSTMDFFSNIAKKTLTSIASEVMQKGIPLPLPQGLKLKHPHLSFQEHHLLVQSDIDIDETFITRLLKLALDNSSFPS